MVGCTLILQYISCTVLSFWAIIRANGHTFRQHCLCFGHAGRTTRIDSIVEWSIIPAQCAIRGSIRLNSVDRQRSHVHLQSFQYRFGERVVHGRSHRDKSLFALRILRKTMFASHEANTAVMGLQRDYCYFEASVSRNCLL